MAYKVKLRSTEKIIIRKKEGPIIGKKVLGNYW